MLIFVFREGWRRGRAVEIYKEMTESKWSVLMKERWGAGTGSLLKRESLALTVREWTKTRLWVTLPLW